MSSSRSEVLDRFEAGVGGGRLAFEIASASASTGELWVLRAIFGGLHGFLGECLAGGHHWIHFSINFSRLL